VIDVIDHVSEAKAEYEKDKGSYHHYILILEKELEIYKNKVEKARTALH
jgi:hypothetical protein